MTVRAGWTWLALAPLCWMVQGAAAWYVTGRACPAAAPPLSLAAARGLVVAITLAAMVGSVGALVAADRARRNEQARAGVRAAAEVVERKRFIALAGLVVGVALTLGLLMSGLPAIVLHACGAAR